MAAVARPSDSEVGVVPDYRVYLLDPDGHVIRRIDLNCAEEREAKEKAKQLVNGHDVELWDGGCLIEVFRHQA
jgi:hypothetical protein